MWIVTQAKSLEGAVIQKAIADAKNGQFRDFGVITGPSLIAP